MWAWALGAALVGLVLGGVLGGVIGYGAASEEIEQAKSTQGSTAAELNATESELESLSGELDDRSSELDQRSADLDTREQELVATEQQIEANTIPGDGTYLVGTDIQPGQYRSEGNSFCYWERTSGTSGEFGDIIANGTVEGQGLVTVDSGDVAFKSQGCSDWIKIG